MAENIELLQKATKFLPLASCLKKLAKTRKLSQDFQPSVAVIQNEGCTNISDSKISLPYFEEIAACCDINIKKVPLKKECNIFQVLDSIKKLNNDPKVHGIFVDLPCSSFDSQLILDAILPNKDITGLNRKNVENVDLNNDEIHPCTAAAVIEILDERGIYVENENILVFEEETSSFPISKVLLHQNSVVTVCSNTVQYAAIIKMAVEQLREICKSRGAHGIIGLSRCFRLMDDNRDRKLDLEEMKLGLQEYGANMNANQVAELFKEIDRDGSGTVSIEEFLRAVRPPLSQERLDIIERAFAKMDKTGDGCVTLEDLKGVYNGKEHPDVKEGKKTEDAVLEEFLQNFDYPNKGDGKVTKQEFIDYYTGVSSNIDLDEYFVTMMEKAWQL